MASTPPILPLCFLGHFFLACQGISLDAVAGRGPSGRGASELWREPAALDRADRSNPDDGCLDAEFGDRCYELVTWCLDKGIKERPDWFTAFRPTASRERDFKQVQGILHGKGKAGCGRPCSTLVQQLQRAQDARGKPDGVRTTPSVQHPRRVWVATAPPTTSLEAPRAEAQEAPEVEVQGAPGAEAQEVSKVEVQEAPDVEALGAPNAEALEAPKVEVQEAPKAEAQEAPEVEVLKAPNAEVQEQPKFEVQEVPNAEVQEPPTVEVQKPPTAEVQETPRAEVQEAPEVEVQEPPKVEVQELPKAQRADDFERPAGHATGGDEAVPEPYVRDRKVGMLPGAHESEDPFIIDGYGQGGHWGDPGEES